MNIKIVLLSIFIINNHLAYSSELSENIRYKKYSSHKRRSWEHEGIKILVDFAEHELRIPGPVGNIIASYLGRETLSHERDLYLGSWHGVTHTAPLNEQYVATGSSDGTIKVYDISQEVCAHVFTEHRSPITALIALNETVLVSGDQHGIIKIWHLNPFKCIRTLTDHTKRVNALAQLSPTCFASGSDDRNIRIWNIDLGRCQKIIRNNGCITSLVKLSHNTIAASVRYERYANDPLHIFHRADAVSICNTEPGHYIKEFVYLYHDIHTLRSLETGNIIIHYTNRDDFIQTKKIRMWTLDSIGSRDHIDLAPNSSTYCAYFDDTTVLLDNLQQRLFLVDQNTGRWKSYIDIQHTSGKTSIAGICKMPNSRRYIVHCNHGCVHLLNSRIELPIIKDSTTCSIS